MSSPRATFPDPSISPTESSPTGRASSPATGRSPRSAAAASAPGSPRRSSSGRGSSGSCTSPTAASAPGGAAATPSNRARPARLLLLLRLRRLVSGADRVQERDQPLQEGVHLRRRGVRVVVRVGRRAVDQLQVPPRDPRVGGKRLGGRQDSGTTERGTERVDLQA